MADAPFDAERRTYRTAENIMTTNWIQVRLSHLLSHSGVGAIVRGPHGTVVVQDIRNWKDKGGNTGGEFIPYVERVRAALEIEQELRSPPVATESKGRIDGTCIPATRFPGWMRCPNPKCGALYCRPWKEQSTDEPRCAQCGRKPTLEQLAWVLVDKHGYLSDVDWHSLTHRYVNELEQKHCKVRNQLALNETGYGRRELRCGACGARNAFNGDEHISFGGGWMQPWPCETVPPSPDGPEPELAQVLRINDTRLHSPLTGMALVIPPESRAQKGSVLDRLYRNSGMRAKIDRALQRQRNSILRDVADELRCTVADIKAAYAELARGYPLYGRTFTPGQLLEDEYAAFLEVLDDRREDEDFVPVDRSDAWQHYLNELYQSASHVQFNVVEHLIRVDRLKAVKVFRGFKRLGGDTVPPDLAGGASWLPAVELHGEGIFLTLDERRLAVWESDEGVQKRLEDLMPRFVASEQNKPNPLTARFMLLHTLAHLLIREIEAHGGYPAASLSERIYCATAPTPMAGILIWVAVPDIAGSLGGLAELAEPRRFANILAEALDHARWCSLDPVCSEHEGQGPALLNRAACHACALIPEPACDYGNALLDRVFVKGNDDDVPSLFDAEIG